VHSKEDKSDHASIKDKKTVLDKRETKNNLFQGNRKKSSVDSNVVEKAAYQRQIKDGSIIKKKESTIKSNVVSVEKPVHERQIKGENVQKKRKDNWCNNKARRGFRFSTFVKNDKMGIKKKYGHRVKVFFGHARRWLKTFFSKPWKRDFRKQRFLFSTRKGRLKRKLYRNIKISKQLFTVGKKRIVTSKQLLRAKRVEYRKYKKRKRRPRKRRVFRIPPGGKVGLIALKGSYNNIILTLTDTDGNTKAWVSAGTAGFKNGQKSSHVAAETAIDRLVDKSVAIGYKFARVKMKGMGGSKLKAIRRLCKSRLKLIGISDHFLIPHNGCRRARKPRN
jgi:small subunit ribosomal protein S11